MTRDPPVGRSQADFRGVIRALPRSPFWASLSIGDDTSRWKPAPTLALCGNPPIRLAGLDESLRLGPHDHAADTAKRERVQMPVQAELLVDTLSVVVWVCRIPRAKVDTVTLVPATVHARKRRGDVMTSLELYVDESADASKQNLVVAGYVSTIDAWEEFGPRWNERLAAYGVPYFHMKDFVSPRSSLFRHLQGPKRTAMLRDLIALIRMYSVIGVSSSICPHDYNSLTSAEFRGRYGAAYTVALSGCILTLGKVFSDHSIPLEELSVFMEDGHPNVRQAYELLREHKASSQAAGNGAFRIGSLGMGTKLDKPPLQAADLLAYCCLSDNPYSRVTVTAILLNGGVHHVAHEWSRESMLQMKDMIAEDEAERASQRHQIHEVSRFLGNFGVRVRSVPGGVEIDSTNLKEVNEADIERMIKNDPSIEVSRVKKPAN